MKFKINEIKIAVIGGLIAQIAFEAYAWLISPIVFGPQLQPSLLVMGLVKKSLGISLSYEMAFGLHALIGIIGFGIFTLFFYKLLNGRAMQSGVIAGVVLWFIAQGILAPAMGRDFMMGFGAYTQSSFVSHVGMALIIACYLKFKTEVTNEKSHWVTS